MIEIEIKMEVDKDEYMDKDKDKEKDKEKDMEGTGYSADAKGIPYWDILAKVSKEGYGRSCYLFPS